MIPVQIQPLVRRGNGTGPKLVAEPAITETPVGDIVLRAARLSDMDAVQPIIADYARKGLLLPKSLEQLYRTFREFLVAEDEEGRVVGCVALRVHTPTLAEVSALAVAEGGQGRGIGRRLVERLVKDARALGVQTLFAMTLEPVFFGKLGFREVERALFPTKIVADCLGCPRRDECNEITMARWLQPADADGFTVEASNG
ncbi:MAG TPA: N-acetyltransferase [Longimicrobiales bacterium]|nr:N-acetyltransferase [Longimicrobiales bacterium]